MHLVFIIENFHRKLVFASHLISLNQFTRKEMKNSWSSLIKYDIYIIVFWSNWREFSNDQFVLTGFWELNGKCYCSWQIWVCIVSPYSLGHSTSPDFFFSIDVLSHKPHKASLVFCEWLMERMGMETPLLIQIPLNIILYYFVYCCPTST